MLNTVQIALLVLLALTGVPAGFFIARNTKEELRPGKKWFKIISAASVAAAVSSPLFVEGGMLALALTVSAFIFFISSTPLIRKNGRR